MGARGLQGAFLVVLSATAVAAVGCGPHLVVGGGLGRIDYHGDDGARVTPFLGARVGVPDEGVRGILLAEVQPIPVAASGSYDVSTLFLVPCLEGVVGPTHLRGGVGFILNLYSNDHSANAGEGNPAGGLALTVAASTHLRRSGRWGAEVFATTTGEPSRQEGALMVGVELLRYVR